MPATTELPLIAIMIGDPAGVGPEVCVKALASCTSIGNGDGNSKDEQGGLCRPVLIGDIGVLKRAMAVAKVSLPLRVVATLEEPLTDENCVRVLDPGGFDVSACAFGLASAASGHAVLDWTALGTALGESGAIQGLVMAPMDSESIKLTGRIKHIDDLQPPDTFMFRMSGALRVVPLSEHLPLVDAIAMVKPGAVLKLIEVLNKNLCRWGLPQPRIAVAGINPHAMFPQDQQQIGPAIEQARQQGIDVSGPISPDSVFRMAIEGKYDAVVTMYHDQGQIALKTSNFEGACTVYLGLPYIMLNVPHGSAFDIAGTGIAQHESMLAAITTAARMASGQGIFQEVAGGG